MKIMDKIKSKLENTLGNEYIGDAENPYTMSDMYENSQTNDITYKKSRNNYPVLEVLGIEEDIDISGLITPDDIANTEFTLVAPTGINPKEVESFCDNLIIQLGKYRELIIKRQQDFKVLLDENANLVNKMAEQKQESDLASLLMTQKNSEDKLREQVINLQNENRELKEKLKSAQTTQEKKPEDVLRTVKQEPKKSPFSSKFKKQLVNDDFDNLLNDIED